MIDASGKRPVLRNVTAVEIQALREQVQIIDIVGCENLDEISARIQDLSQQPVTACGCSECGGTSHVAISTTPRVVAGESSDVVRMDNAGYFIIFPSPVKKIITVEYYTYDNVLLRTIEGASAREIYAMIIKEGWISELSHAAYLGKELARAELSIQNGSKYVQDGA